MKGHEIKNKDLYIELSKEIDAYWLFIQQNSNMGTTIEYRKEVKARRDAVLELANKRMLERKVSCPEIEGFHHNKKERRVELDYKEVLKTKISTKWVEVQCPALDYLST